MNGSLLLKNLVTLTSPQPVDLLVENGKIAQLQPAGSGLAAAETLDLEGRFACPGFVDSHTHPDKAYMPCGDDAGDLMGAIRMSEAYMRSLPAEQVQEDVCRRASRMFQEEIRHGTTALKAQIEVNSIWGLHSLEGVLQAREAYRDQLDVYTVVPLYPGLEDLLEQAAREGKIDFLGGYPTLSKDYRDTVDRLFAFAEKWNLPMDLHVDESDAADIRCFCYVLEKTIRHGMQGKVTCGHVTALGAVPEKEARQAIQLCAQAGVHITMLTSCNLYLMGRSDPFPMRRGITRAADLLEAGVNVAYASDNIRDPFRPFGNGNLVEEGLLTAQVMQYGTPSKLRTILEMGTYAGARNTGLKGYGLTPGCHADLVVLDAPDFQEALLGNVPCRLVMKNGRITVRDGKLAF